MWEKSGFISICINAPYLYIKYSDIRPHFVKQFVHLKLERDVTEGRVVQFNNNKYGLLIKLAKRLKIHIHTHMTDCPLGVQVTGKEN